MTRVNSREPAVWVAVSNHAIVKRSVSPICSWATFIVPVNVRDSPAGTSEVLKETPYVLIIETFVYTPPPG